MEKNNILASDNAYYLASRNNYVKTYSDGTKEFYPSYRKVSDYGEMNDERRI